MATNSSGGASASTDSGEATSSTGSDASTTGSATSGSGCPVTTDDFLEPTFEGTASFAVPAALGGGDGGWTSYGDETSDAMITLTAASVPGGTNSITCEVNGFTDWGGCLMIFYSILDLVPSGVNALQFWARAPEDHEIRVNISDRNSDYQGGVCDGAQNCFENCCHDHYGAQFTAAANWTQYTFRFDQLTREDGNGPPFAFDPSHVREIGFRGAEGGDFELEIDELAFVTCD
jgi:hypothetical protein